jgi:hypothetical protein
MGIGTYEVVVRVANPTGRTCRIIGMLQGCRPNVCFRSKHAEPVEVPSGGTVTYACEVNITGSGPFEFPLYLYLEDNGIRAVDQTLRGTAVAPRDGIHGGNPKAGL